MLPLGTQNFHFLSKSKKRFFFFLKKQIQIIIVNNSRKNKQKEMYTGAPEKCLEVFAFTKKPPQKNQEAVKQTYKQTKMLSNFPSKTVQVPPWQKSRKKHKRKKKQTNKHRTYLS